MTPNPDFKDMPLFDVEETVKIKKDIQVAHVTQVRVTVNDFESHSKILK